MKIHLIPQRSDKTLTVTKTGETFIINNISYDFSTIQETSDWIITNENNINQTFLYQEDMLVSLDRYDGELEMSFAVPVSAGILEDGGEEIVLTDPPDGKIWG